MKKVISFIRLTEAGSFEKITWLKNNDGSKTMVIETVQPTEKQALQIATSPYHEVYC